MRKKQTRIYRAIRWCVNAVYPDFKVEGLQNMPQEPVIVVGNHAQMTGPLAGELRFPGEHYLWCAAEMMHKETVADYAYQDFWSKKPKWLRPFYKLLSHMIVPVAVCIFTNARTIGVYRDARIMSTFKETLQCLEDGANVIIYPEHEVAYNHIVYEFQQNFVDVARLYYRRTGKRLQFVPMYLAPKLRTIYLGTPISFDPAQSIETERKRICTYCMDHITEIAVGLPEHTVVPYPNMPKKQWRKNK